MRLHRMLLSLGMLGLAAHLSADNPIITEVFTADPAAMVHGDTVYLYTGHDDAGPKDTTYGLKEWLCFSSKDMVYWTAHGAPLAVKNCSWAKANAYAGHVIERDGNFSGLHPCGWATGAGSPSASPFLTTRRGRSRMRAALRSPRAT
jgi:arabinoxylan arabinofuranohydrolase